MSYPHFSDKFKFEAAFNPKESTKLKIPKKIIIVYPFPWMKRYIAKKYKTKSVRINSLIEILVSDNVGFVIMKGVGSPHATITLEEIITVGGREFINLGTAGGLQKNGVFLCTKAIRDEGTSHHYLKFGKYVMPNKQLTKKLSRTLKGRKLNFSEGISWTIDALYRETKKEIEKYKKEGVSTIEMEAAALFAVGKYRKVRVASAFVVRDIPEKTDKNGNRHRFDYKKELKQLIDAGVACLQK